MIKINEGYEPSPERPKDIVMPEEELQDEYVESNKESEWGKEMCATLEEIMGGASEADFCNAEGEVLYHVKTLAAGYHYTIKNIRKTIAYGVATTGYTHLAIGTAGELKDFHVSREEVAHDIDALKNLTMKKSS